jgi:hypothetical protein
LLKSSEKNKSRKELNRRFDERFNEENEPIENISITNNVIEKEIISNNEELIKLQEENKDLNTVLEIAQNKLKRTNKIRYAKVDYSKFLYSSVQQFADDTRKKNGTLNYKAISEKLNLSDHTAKNICSHFNIK